jgi:hypothetical protein
MSKVFRFVAYALLSVSIYFGCSSSDEPEKVDCTLSDLSVEAAGQNPADCASGNGSISVTPAGGKEPYKFALNTGSFGSSSTFTNLGAGDFMVRVKDKNGCEVATTVSLQIPGADALTATTDVIEDTECFGSNGSVEVIAAGGTPPYQFKIGAGAFNDISTFNGLAPGNYSLAVKDGANCVFTKGITVGRGDTGTSLELDVKPIIEQNCAITNCHNGSQSPDLRSIANIRSHASQIKSLTQSGEMPKDGNLTATEKALIACWVDDGAKNN